MADNKWYMYLSNEERRAMMHALVETIGNIEAEQLSCTDNERWNALQDGRARALKMINILVGSRGCELSLSESQLYSLWQSVGFAVEELPSLQEWWLRVGTTAQFGHELA